MPCATKATFVARFAFACLALTCAGPAVAQQDDAEAAPLPHGVSALVKEHALAQQGLSLGLAANIAQSQMAFFDAPAQVNKCASVSGGGSAKTLQFAATSPDTVKITVELYYVKQCKQHYLNIAADATKFGDNKLTLTGSATIYGLDGKVLGKMAISESLNVFVGGDTDQLSGTATFTPTGSTPVFLGYDCGLPSTPMDTTVHCHVGVAQRSKPLGVDLASLTPITVKLPKAGTAAFTANKGQLVRGSLGALRISAPTNTTLKITGTSAAVGTTKGKGSFASFSMLPKGPSSWTSTDSANDLEFSITMATNATELTGAITKISTDATLASFSLDVSGTGEITYSNNAKARITAWTLAN